MKIVILSALALLASATAQASPPVRVVAETTTRSIQTDDPAPWWMRDGIIASLGEVETHIPANRASFSAQFSAVDKSLPTAQREVAERVKALARTLQAYGAEKAQVSTSLSVTPIYEQYKDKQGELQSNERADRIDRYEASVRFAVSVRDVSVLECAYAAVISAHPTSIQQVYFNLEPDNETKTELFKDAVIDAAQRARLAVEATGGKLGRVRLIDPTGRACQTDVLVAGADRGYGGSGQASEVVVTAQRRRSALGLPPPPPPAPAPIAAPGEEVAPRRSSALAAAAGIAVAQRVRDLRAGVIQPLRSAAGVC